MDHSDIARVTHEANRALQTIQNDPTIPVSLPWDIESEAQRASVIDGVQKIASGEIVTPEESHENWRKFKLNNGWVFGPVKDEAKKEHPLLVPYDELPESQQLKDALFFAIIDVLAP